MKLFSPIWLLPLLLLWGTSCVRNVDDLDRNVQ